MPIGQSRQRIIVRHVAHARFGLFFSAHVTDDATKADSVARSAGCGAGADRPPAGRLPIFLRELECQAAKCPTVDQVIHKLCALRADLEQIFEQAAVKVLRRKASLVGEML